ncbi:Por secretion system C-terminal sorting domain-containing protein [Fodinibius salinus]|uniref:Por secretion system C-terminal sorting domain-containing protein n=1 Tax=Fodinibius salinus TaxID=860790 RepID=A0A5D3YJG9_9BACT|nr:MXAN_6640 family putative metalloprotease [Fodinibius salinus]TYP93913.1 Por secretion system C-terminal sorting domain-containing protein [Fodinibius salinus]
MIFKRLPILIFLLCLFFYQAGYSQQGESVHNHNAYHTIDQAYKAGKLTLDQKVLYKFYLSKNSSKLPDQYRLPAQSAIKCGTPAYMDFERNRSQLSAATINKIKSMTAAPTAQASQTYSSPSGNFEIHYQTSGSSAVPNEDTNTNGIPDYVEKVATAADSSYSHEVQTLGYSDPISPSTSYEIQIQNVAPTFGLTSPNTTNPNRSYYCTNSISTCIFIENDFAEGFPPNDHPDGNQTGAINVTMAHEFKHAIQYEANSWSGETGAWLEMDATLMEEVVYDNVNDYYNYLDSDQSILSDPTQSFYPGSYEHVSWALFFEEKFGSQFWVNVWQIISNSPNITMVKAVTQQLGGQQAYMQNYVESQMWHYASGNANSPASFGFEERTDYPSPNITSTFFGDDSLANPDTLQLMSAGYHTVQAAPFSGSVAINSEIDFVNKIMIGVLGYFKNGTTEFKTFSSHNSISDQFITGWKWDKLNKIGIVAANGKESPPNPVYTLKVRSVQPTENKLEQNFPNPFSNQTTIRYSLTQQREVTLEIFDVLGRKISTIVDRPQKAGIYTYPVTAEGMASGVYFYRLTLDGNAETQKMTLIK